MYLSIDNIATGMNSAKSVLLNPDINKDLPAEPSTHFYCINVHNASIRICLFVATAAAADVAFVQIPFTLSQSHVMSPSQLTQKQYFLHNL
jgi:hypothetical protein